MGVKELLWALAESLRMGMGDRSASLPDTGYARGPALTV